MAMRTITFEESYSPDEIAKLLCDAGFPADATLGEILKRDLAAEVNADEAIVVECVVDEDDVVEKLGDEAIVTAYRDLEEAGCESRAVEDGIRYVRAGDISLARAMFERVFDGEKMRAAERALA